jgi:hypothetical protein
LLIIDASTRRAALIASAIALPVTVVLAFVFTSGEATRKTQASPSATSSAPAVPLTAVEVAAPPAPSADTEQACVKVLSQLPISLTADLPPRRVNSTSALVRAWGEPAVVVRCGVPALTNLTPADGEQILAVNGVNWLPVQTSSATVFTTVDRSVAVELTVPKASVAQPLPLISNAVGQLPAVCTTIDAAGHHDANLPICGSTK